MKRALPLLVVPLVAAGAASALGTSPTGPAGGSAWTRVTDANGRNIDQVGLARTGDGKLHVLWRRRTGPTNEAIVHAPIAPNGTKGGETVVLGGFNAVGDPDVVVLPDGRLRAFFMGLGRTNEEGGVVSATAPSSGAAWTREGVRVSSSTKAVGPVGAALTSAGAPVFAYAMSFFLGLHVGLDPVQQDVRLSPDNRCCDYLPDLATDAATGESVLAWYSNADGRRGIWAQRVLPAPGGRLLAPGSVVGGKAITQDQRTPIAARLRAGGVYVGYCGGYPSCKRALLWRVGAGAPLSAGGSLDVEDVNISPGPEGRLWVMWHDGKSKRVYARRTNKAATRFGPLLELPPPPRTSSIWKLSGEGSRGPLDLMVSASTPGSLATWHRRLLPKLTVSVSIVQSTKTAKFTIRDAGDPVAGARVFVGGKAYFTNAAGKATATLTKSGTYTATVWLGADAYQLAKVTVRIN